MLQLCVFQMITSVLWQKLLDSEQTEERLVYDVLHQLVVDGQLDSFPPDAADILLELLDEIHEPQVWLLACVLFSQMCNLTSVARSHLAQRGALSSLAIILNRSISSLIYITPSSEQGNLYRVLVKFVMLMLQHFSLGASVCICKILQHSILSTVLCVVDCTTSALYSFGSAETKMQLKSLVAGCSMVGRRVLVPSLDTNTIYSRLLGCDIADVLGADFPACDSYDVDLYDTNGDEDIHIIEQLMLSCGSSDSESLFEDLDSFDSDDGEWVDVYVTFVLDGAHFVAVFGAERIKQFHQLCKSVQAAVASCSMSLTHLPPRGQLVCVSHPELGGYWAYVVNTSRNNKVLTFAPDYGYVEEVPLSYLRTFDDCCLTPPSQPLVQVCKLMGECPLCLTHDIDNSFGHMNSTQTLIHVITDTVAYQGSEGPWFNSNLGPSLFLPSTSPSLPFPSSFPSSSPAQPLPLP